MYGLFSDEWNIVTKMPRNIASPSIASINNKIYVTGSTFDYENGDLLSTYKVQCYDIETEAWSEVANMNKPRTFHRLLNIYEKLYVIEGNRLNDDDDSFEVYDPDKNIWTLIQQNLDTKLLEYMGTCLVNKQDLIMDQLASPCDSLKLKSSIIKKNSNLEATNNYEKKKKTKVKKKQKPSSSSNAKQERVSCLCQ